MSRSRLAIPNVCAASSSRAMFCWSKATGRISGIIKYLTQSTWSHSALYVGPISGASDADGAPHVLIEANVGEGVVSAPLHKYFNYHTRICRPVGLSYEDRITVCRYAINRIGFGYDTKNITDLMLRT